MEQWYIALWRNVFVYIIYFLSKIDYLSSEKQKHKNLQNISRISILYILMNLVTCHWFSTYNQANTILTFFSLVVSWGYPNGSCWGLKQTTRGPKSHMQKNLFFTFNDDSTTSQKWQLEIGEHRYGNSGIRWRIGSSHFLFIFSFGRKIKRKRQFPLF